MITKLADILPGSLETLHFAHSTGRIGILAKALQTLLNIQQQRLPMLREITVEANLAVFLLMSSSNTLQDLATCFNIYLRIIDTSRPENMRNAIGKTISYYGQAGLTVRIPPIW